MKANKLFFLAITSFLSLQSLSPDLILKTNLRSPASDEKVEEKKDEKKPEATICKSELKGEKLEADVKKSLSDKEEVISKLENKIEAKAESKLESKDEVKKSDNSEILALMSQMTTMFTLQMQNQMQMQIQMMSMLSMMQSNALPITNPYSPMLYPNSFSYGYPSLSDSLNTYGMGIGIPAQVSPWSNYNNPYSIMPSVSQQPAPSAFNYGFDFNQNQNSELPQLSRQQIPGAANLGYDFNQERAPAQQPLPAVGNELPTLQRL